MKIECRVPLRVDLAGGWSDIPPFAREEGGAVLSVAISTYVTGEVVVDDGGGVRISYGVDLPPGSGLGSSAALSVAWLALVHGNMGALPPPEGIARDACELAALLGIKGGKQDEYTAALGGVNLLRFVGDSVHAEPVAITDAVRDELEARMVLCYSGQARLSGDIHDRVWGAYERGDRAVGSMLARLRDIAVNMAAALEAGDFAAVARLLDENWAAQRRLHPSITNGTVDALFDIAREAGAAAGKACGAGGGGCIIFLAEPRQKERLREALARAGARLIDVGIDQGGLQVARV